ncbi:hypothetical protein ACIOTI_32110 [Streptomyces sp. NPDC087843]|uniref:hypothetical protein n=1 Tax=Streptomyces sp. NPDC087843 TaxID=3365804 RepID=UPI0038124D30
MFILIAIVGVMASGGKDDAKAGSKNTDNTSGKAKAGSNDAKSADTALFKVWGTAPAGALGGLDIGYGSNSDTRKGTFKNGKFEATVPMTDGAMYYSVTAQLQGSGDINCSVTVDEKTRTGHASGGYNICSAQLSSDFTGDWR